MLDPDDGTAVNDGSLVLRAATPAGSVLLTGDIELSAQADLLDAGVPLRADVLKMPHHGSRYTAPGFLAAVGPRAVLVSVGAGNRYRHPDRALLDRLAAAGAVTRRTDQAGDVAVVAGPGAAARAPSLTLVSRGDPRPARRRRRQRGAGGARASPVRARAPPAPRRRPCGWPARSRSGRSARPPRRGSSARHR